MDETIGDSGHTLEQLSAYFDAGRVPRIAAIEDDAEARAVLASMERLSRLTRELADEESTAAEPAWVERVLDVVRSEVRAGRDLPMHAIDARTETTVTEGALRELARRAGDDVGDVLVGSVVLRSRADALDVRITIGVRFGAPVRLRADAVREAVRSAVDPHAPRPLGRIDVVVDDIFEVGEGDHA